MRLFHQLVFDDASMGGAPAVTAVWFEELLASADGLAIMVVAEAASAAVSLDVVLQHSSDGRHWLNKSTLATLALSTSAVTLAAAGDGGAVPTLRRARLRLVPAAATNVRLRVWATGRTLDAHGGAPSPMPREGEPGCSCERPPARAPLPPPANTGAWGRPGLTPWSLRAGQPTPARAIAERRR
jgi:hypothetical protein